MTCFSLLMGSIQMLVLILLTKIDFVSILLSDHGLKNFANIPIFQGINFNNLISLIYIGIFVTGLGYTFFFLAMEETSASTASIVFFIKPALAPILALLILHEAISVNTIGGIALIIIGSVVNFVCNNKMQESALESECKEESIA